MKLVSQIPNRTSSSLSPSMERTFRYLGSTVDDDDADGDNGGRLLPVGRSLHSLPIHCLRKRPSSMSFRRQ